MKATSTVHALFSTLLHLPKLPIYCEDSFDPSRQNLYQHIGRLLLDPAIAFGKVLRAVRKETNMSQEQLALTAGVERNFVSLIERGINQLTIRVVFKLAHALQISPARLVELTEREAKLL